MAHDDPEPADQPRRQQGADAREDLGLGAAEARRQRREGARGQGEPVRQRLQDRRVVRLERVRVRRARRRRRREAVEGEAEVDVERPHQRQVEDGEPCPRAEPVEEALHGGAVGAGRDEPEVEAVLAEVGVVHALLGADRRGHLLDAVVGDGHGGEGAGAGGVRAAGAADAGDGAAVDEAREAGDDLGLAEPEGAADLAVGAGRHRQVALEAVEQPQVERIAEQHVRAPSGGRGR